MMLDVEAEITEKNVTEATAESISLLEPYGAGNPVPLFVLRGAKITELTVLSGGKHTKMMLSRGDREMYAVIFGNNLSSEGFIVGDEVDIVCSIDINEFRGNKNVQLIIRDIDRSASDKKRIGDEFAAVEAALKSPATIDSADKPQRDDFVKVYTSLKDAESENVDLRVLAQSFPELSYIKLAVIIEALGEAGIIDVSGETVRPFLKKIKINKVDKKTDHSQTPIMKELEK